MDRNSREPRARGFWQIQNVKWHSQFWLWLPCLVYYGIITFLSSIPGSEIQLHWFFQWEHSDKIGHYVIYSGLGFLLSRAVLWERDLKVWTRSWRLYFLLLIFCLPALDEYHQSFVPNRSMDFWDYVADILGAFSGLGWYMVYRSFRGSFLESLHHMKKNPDYKRESWQRVLYFAPPLLMLGVVKLWSLVWPQFLALGFFMAAVLFVRALTWEVWWHEEGRQKILWLGGALVYGALLAFGFSGLGSVVWWSSVLAAVLYGGGLKTLKRQGEKDRPECSKKVESFEA